MNVCNKCGIDKPDDQYETYWHSTKKKYFTRRICVDCIKKQQKEYRLKIRQGKLNLDISSTNDNITQPDPPESFIEDFSTNPDYKFCVGCETWKLKTEYFVAKNKTRQTYTIFKRCKKCHNSNNREKSKLYWEEKRKNYGGSEHVCSKPGKYEDEFQKEQTFWVMNLIGWEYNEEKNIWTKKGIKELVDGKIVWPNIKEKTKRIFNPEKKILPDKERKDVDIDKLISLRNLGWSWINISLEMKTSIPTLRNRLLKYNQKT